MKKDTFIDKFDILYTLLAAVVYKHCMRSEQHERGLCLNIADDDFVIDEFEDEYHRLGIERMEFRLDRDKHVSFKYDNILLVNYTMREEALKASIEEYKTYMLAALALYKADDFFSFKLHEIQDEYSIEILLNYEFV